MALHDLTPQLRTRLRRMEKIVGLFVAVAAVLLLVGFAYYVYHTAVRRGWLTPKVSYYTFVRSADGLKLGDPVLLMGFSVGEITVIEAEPPDSSYNVFVGFQVRKPYYGYIWADSRARITAGGFLGGRRLEVTKGQSGAPTVYESEGHVAELLVGGRKVAVAEAPQGVPLEPDEAPALSERAEQLVARLEEALPSITGKLDGALGNAEHLTANLDDLVTKARPVVANLDTITTNLRDPKGSLGEWLLPPDLRTRLEQTLQGVDANLVRLQRTLGESEAAAGSLRSQLDSNRHVLGDVSDLVRDTDDLVQGLKRHWLLRGAFPQPTPGASEPRLDPLLGPPEAPAP